MDGAIATPCADAASASAEYLAAAINPAGDVLEQPGTGEMKPMPSAIGDTAVDRPVVCDEELLVEKPTEIAAASDDYADAHSAVEHALDCDQVLPQTSASITSESPVFQSESHQNQLADATSTLVVSGEESERTVVAHALQQQCTTVVAQPGSPDMQAAVDPAGGDTPAVPAGAFGDELTAATAGGCVVGCCFGGPIGAVACASIAHSTAPRQDSAVGMIARGLGRSVNKIWSNTEPVRSAIDEQLALRARSRRIFASVLRFDSDWHISDSVVSSGRAALDTAEHMVRSSREGLDIACAPTEEIGGASEVEPLPRVQIDSHSAALRTPLVT